MSTNDLKNQLKEIIAEIIEVEEFGDDVNFVDELGVDSMMTLEIVASVERTFKISIPEQYLPEMHSLNDVTRIVSEVQAAVQN